MVLLSTDFHQGQMLVSGNVIQTETNYMDLHRDLDPLQNVIASSLAYNTPCHKFLINRFGRCHTILLRSRQTKRQIKKKY